MKKNVFMYCRKSSESEDRQILSIQSQINELKIIAKRLNLNVIEILEESQSAKAPGRPVFTKMLGRLMSNEVEGVLCWKLDRLARNSVDGGSIIWAIKNNNVSIYTPSQTFSREQDNSFLMYIEFGSAQKFIDDLGKNAKRGMNTKAEMGWWPQHAPMGYANTPNGRKGLKTIIKDGERFDIVKKCFDEVINGRNGMAVYETAVNDWKLTNPKTGKPIATSTFYKMLNNPFYFGDFYWNDRWFSGKHEAMISKDDFDVVQRMLGQHGKPIQRAQTFDLTGLFRCQQCGCALTASRKVKYYGSERRKATYVYYHCTKKKKNINCTQQPITELELTKQITDQLLEVNPSQGFIDWAKKWMQFLHEHESDFQEKVIERSHTKLEQTETRLNKLLDLYLSESITEAEYNDKKAELEKAKLELKRKVDETDEELTSWRSKVEDALDFAKAAAYKFEHGTKDEKHQLLIKISSDLTYRTKNPLIHLKKEYAVLRKLNKGEYATDVVARTSKYDDIWDKRPDLVPIDSTWLPV